ncbi:hypothetical protein [Candidatus Xianfuyuplasma coldseepsis]|uniref:Uncharacterized protein n=1 Tax=Candidatus Xianfuyuplasma coldseepsis TaxID=2782163 RepID=A0A7L7KQK6_9MOLU|nr:hypothetical protein [Xianfuyuplasma coldseepsis]QMS84562.1 hypothetical protein G4Z02_01960 [Xianfuyuplasma coldseepsis]
MPRTKEELQKIVEKQFSSVTKEELNVYDNAKKLLEAFKKDTKALETAYKKTIKELDQEDKIIEASFKSDLSVLEKELKEALQKLDSQKQQAIDLCVQEIEKHQRELEAAITDHEKQVLASEKDHQKALKSLEKELQKNLDASVKNIEAINEKSGKDQASFDQKINDLKAKYEAKVETLLEKEKTKLAKLQESFNKKVESIHEQIKKEQDAHTKKVVTKKTVYEEELAEIDEKMEYDKSEFDRKHQSIKDAVDKRIQVREKHLQRAIAENDNRSAKQHKKDIAKFRKEADKDLIVLEKNYDKKKKESIDYRTKFMKEFVQDLEDLQKEFAKYKEDKQLDIDQLQFAHNNDLEQVKLDFEQDRADELNKFNSSFAQIREKQEQVLYEKDLAIAKEELQQDLLNAEYVQARDTAIEEVKLTAEEQVKAKLFLELEQHKAVKLSEKRRDETIRTLANEADLLDIEYTNKKAVLEADKQAEHHHVQDKRNNALQEEFVAYQEQLSPLYTKRVEDILAYETAEVNNRLALKMEVYESSQIELDKTYKLLEEKVDAEFTLEASFYEEQIQDIAGDKQDAFNAFVEQNEKELLELQAQIDSLTTLQDRKERKQLESTYQRKKQAFTDEKAHRERELETLVGPYQDGLADVLDRKDKAVKDIRELHQAATKDITDHLTVLKEHSAAELALAKTNLDHITSAFNQFGLQLASRREQQSSMHKSYLDQQLAIEDKRKQQAATVMERSRELLLQQLEEDKQQLQQEEQAFLAEVKSKVQTEEARVEAVKQAVEEAVAAIKAVANEAIAAGNNTLTSKKNDLDQALNQELNQINTTLQTQVADYNQVTADVKKRKQASSSLLESEQKRVKKDSDVRLKEAYTKIEAEHQTLLETMTQ